ncbi:hypothetical protein [Nocardia amamiensis]|uniref:hypothetical protein n=1 Tax=Nocardia amamiensis TaxID=404578 RepID=UPI00082C19D5|nr:hypothetical protein [Nocardia amamiensis]
MHRTTVGDTHAGWRLVGHRIEILFLCDDRDTTPAYRLRSDGSTVPIPLGQCGLVAFDERALPDLAQAREWFPRHFHLWDAVRKHYWQVLLSTHGPHPTDLPLPPQ